MLDTREKWLTNIYLQPTNLSLQSALSCTFLSLSSPKSHLFTTRERKRGREDQEFFFLVTMAFAGTTQKCMACEKTVYLVDKLTADNRVYHKACFRCHHCRGTLKVSLKFELKFLVIFACKNSLLDSEVLKFCHNLTLLEWIFDSEFDLQL